MSEKPDLSSDAQREIMRNLHIESRRYVAPIYWSSDPYDANTVRNNGSCFVIEIGELRFGVTAHHVIAAYLAAREKQPETQLIIRNTLINDWDGRFIDGDEGLDIATFRLTSDEVAEIEILPFCHAPEKWPPSPPQLERGIFFTGFPGVDRRVLNKKVVEFLGVSNGVVVTNIDDDTLEMTINRSDLTNFNGTPVKSLEYDLGGFSGAPALVVSAEVPGPLFWLGGAIIKQWPPGGGADLTIVLARRPTCIQIDGRLIRPFVSPQDGKNTRAD